MIAADLVHLASALNRAGLAVFHAVAGEANVSVSPVSIGVAFGMVDAGASGPVDAALDRLFAYPSHGEALLATFRALGDTVSSEAGDGAVNSEGDVVPLPEVRIANALWLDRSFTPAPAYVDAVTTWFHAEASALDLRGDPVGSRERIDGWVRERTRGLILRILADGTPTPDTESVLVNAVYLKAQWWAPFDPDSTSRADFHLLDGAVVDTDLMVRDLRARSVIDDAYDAVALPYVGDLEMLVVVPRAGRFTEVRDAFDVDSVTELDSRWVAGRTLVHLPRFTARAEIDLRAAIETGLGIAGLFGAVGLDGIGPDLALDTAVHATTVIVDESGTEAAAATAIGIMLTGMPLYDAEIRADRPFLYAIRETATGALLFVGQLLEPTAG